jgi:hypothetical protein
VAQPVAAAVPGLAAQLDTAVHSGGELRIPLSDYVSKIAVNPALAKPLLEHLRLEGESYSKAQATASMVDHDQALQQQAAMALQHQEQDGVWQAALDKVRQAVQADISASANADNSAYSIPADAHSSKSDVEETVLQEIKNRIAAQSANDNLVAQENQLPAADEYTKNTSDTLKPKDKKAILDKIIASKNHPVSLNQQDETAADRAQPWPLPADKWLSESVISEVVEKLVSQFTHHPPVFIRDRVREVIPNDVEIDSVVSGMVYAGRIYLFREGLNDAAAVATTLWHELLHYGLRRFLSREQYIAQLGELYIKDAWIRNQANAWINSADGLALQGQESAAYIQARGVDEALAALAESGNQGEFANNSLQSRAIRTVAEWVADLADRFGFTAAAAYWRAVSSEDARKLIRQIFAKLQTDAQSTSSDWAFSADPSFMKQQQHIAEGLAVHPQDAEWLDSVSQVRQAVHKQLNGLGKHDSRVNELYAQLMAAYFGTMAEKVGVLPDEFYEASGLNFAGGQQQGFGLNQSDVVDNQLDDWANGKLKSSVILDLGKASWVLQQFGVPDVTIHKQGEKLLNWIEYGLLKGYEKTKGREWLEHLAESDSRQDQVATALASSTIYENEAGSKSFNQATDNSGVKRSGASPRTDMTGNIKKDDSLSSASDAIVEQHLTAFYQKPETSQNKAVNADRFAFSAAAQQGDSARGQYFPDSRRIELLDQADLSTFLHEAGHFFLDMQFQLAAGIKAQQAAPASQQQGGFQQRGRKPKPKPPQVPKQFTEADIQQLSKDDVLPGNYLTTTKLVLERTREIGAARVNSPLEAAQAMAYLSKNAMERCDALLTDRHGKPLAVVGGFKGSLREVPIFAHTLLTEAFRVKGAVNIWIAHNHPGAAHLFSEQDELGNARMTQLFKDSRLKLRGFLVYGRSYAGGDKWTFEPGPSPLENGQFSFGHHVMPPDSTITVPLLSREYAQHGLMGERMHYPLYLEDIREISGGKSGMIVVNGLDIPTAFVELQKADINRLRGNGRMDKLLRTLSLANGVRVYLVNYGDLSRAAMYNLIGFFDHLQMPVRDLIEIEGDKLSSRRANKFSLEHYKGFKQAAVPKGLAAAIDSVLAIRPTAQGPELERRFTTAADSQLSLSHSQSVALAHRQSGLLLLDSLHSAQAFVPLAAHGDTKAVQQALQLTAAQSAVLVRQADASAAELQPLLAFFRELGLPVQEVQAAADQAEESVSNSHQSNTSPADQQTATEQPAAGQIHEAHQQILADSQILLDWFGLDSLEQWFQLDLEGQRHYHEQFARGFERYLFEGRAPSQALQQLFERFRQWLLQVYRSLRGLNVQLSHEARQVMDRMLAAEQDIKHMQQLRGMRRLFVSAKQAGMTAAEFAAYQAQDKQASAWASAALQLKSVADLQWLQQAENSTLQALQAKHEGRRQQIQQQVQSIVEQMPVYKAKAFLAEQNGPWPLEVVADMFGFSSGDELKQRLAAAAEPQQFIRQWTDSRMQDEQGQLNSKAAIKRAADLAVHNQLRGRCLASEADQLATAAGEMRLFGDVIEQYIQKQLQQQPFAQLEPAQYVRAETRAARQAEQALQGGELRQAAIAKRRQLISFYASREAYRVQDELAAGLVSLDDFEESAMQLNPEYRLQILDLLRRFGAGQAGKPTVSLAGWLKTQQAKGLQPQIAGFLLDGQYHKPFRQLTVIQFRALLDALRQIEHLGLAHNQQLAAAASRGEYV